MITYCKHCVNTCKTLDVKEDCKKYKTEDITQIRKNFTPENRAKIMYFDYGVEINNIVKFKEI